MYNPNMPNGMPTQIAPYGQGPQAQAPQQAQMAQMAQQSQGPQPVSNEAMLAQRLRMG